MAQCLNRCIQIRKITGMAGNVNPADDSTPVYSKRPSSLPPTSRWVVIANTAAENVRDHFVRIGAGKVLHVREAKPPFGIEMPRWVVNTDDALCPADIRPPLGRSLRGSVTYRDCGNFGMGPVHFLQVLKRGFSKWAACMPKEADDLPVIRIRRPWRLRSWLAYSRHWLNC